MHGARRVITFCLLTTMLPIFLLVMPLYLRHNLYADVVYAVTESDIMEISDGVSTMFCSSHTLKMNGTFNAFQMGHKPEVTSYRKHIRLKKSMTLPDDTLEYWGFYLLRGATVALSVCSRFPGASILVVKGDRTLSTCGMLDHNRDKARKDGIFLPIGSSQVKITFETNAQEIIDSKEAPTHFFKSTHQRNTDFQTNQPIFTTETINRLNPSVQSYIQQLLEMQHNRKMKENANILSDRHVRHARTKFREKRSAQISKSKEIEEQTARTERTEAKPMQNQEKFEETMEKVEEMLRKPTQNAQPILRRRKRDISYYYAFNLKTTKPPHFKRHPVPVDFLVENANLTQINENTGAASFANKKSTLEYPPKILRKLEDLMTELENPGDDIAAEVDSNGEKIYISHRYKHVEHVISKRSQDPVKPPALLDRGIKHGGNAFNVNPTEDESSVSSFEDGLFDCYEGNILLAAKFKPSDNCTDVSFLESGKHTQTHHNVTEDGYYYYIFYSDNDIVFNDIHTVFDIYKPTFQYEKVTKSCINQTECEFPLEIMSNDRVIVEIPTRDGIEHEADDVSYLVSTCHPRVGLYVIFPIAVLFLIISCAFL